MHSSPYQISRPSLKNKSPSCCADMAHSRQNCLPAYGRPCLIFQFSALSHRDASIAFFVLSVQLRQSLTLVESFSQFQRGFSRIFSFSVSKLFLHPLSKEPHFQFPIDTVPSHLCCKVGFFFSCVFLSFSRNRGLSC